MPLDWEIVKKKYGGEKQVWVPYIAGGGKFKINRVTDDEIYFTTRANPNAVIKRKHLERFVELIEQGKLTHDLGALTDDYRTLVADDRPSSAVAIIKDLGLL